MVHYTNKLLHFFGQYSKIFGMFQCLEFRIFRVWNILMGRQHGTNIESMLIQCHDIESTLIQC